MRICEEIKEIYLWIDGIVKVEYFYVFWFYGVINLNLRYWVMLFVFFNIYVNKVVKYFLYFMFLGVVIMENGYSMNYVGGY